MRSSTALTFVILCLSLIGAREVPAQRSGFIIGLGIGAGITSYSYSDIPDIIYLDGNTPEEGTKLGLATNLKIGAQVSESLEIYYLGRTNWLNDGRHTVAAGISALAATYVFPSSSLQLSGGIGAANWIPVCGDCSGGGFGFGLTAGVSWEFADFWLLDLALTYGRPEDRGGHVNMFLAGAGISILSH